MDSGPGDIDALMERYARGEDHVFGCLYKFLAPRLFRFCLRLAPCRSDADDLLQDTFLRMHRARATYLPGASVLHWAFAIARSAMLDRLRYRRRRPEVLGVEDDVALDHTLQAPDGDRPESAALAHDLSSLITRELGKMSEKSRAAYVLMREEGLRAREAAAVLGTTEEAVKQRAHRAYEQLRRAVDSAGWEDYGHERFWDIDRPLRVG